MHTYIDLYFTPDGVSPLAIAERLHQHANLSFIVGPHDLVFEWHRVEEFRATLEKIHAALRGTGVSYRVESTVDDPVFVEPPSWPPVLTPEHPRHPGYADPL
jgi:hypothetical protein